MICGSCLDTRIVVESYTHGAGYVTDREVRCHDCTPESRAWLTVTDGHDDGMRSVPGYAEIVEGSLAFRFQLLHENLMDLATEVRILIRRIFRFSK